MIVAEYIAEQLFNQGVRFIFGIPGGPSIPYMEAFRSAGIEFVLTANEATAGIMADVTARLTGSPGVCHATFGPGATNISTGVGGALLDRSPVIVFTSEMDDRMINRTTQMNISHQKLFEPITKATFRMSADNVREVMTAAFEICKSEYPGPVHIGLPTDLYNKEVQESTGFVRQKTEDYPENDNSTIISLLENSRHPLLAVGLTSARLNMGESIKRFLEKYPMPVVLTPMAKGLVGEDHHCYAGVLFHSLSDYLEDIYEKTDLVIGLGYDPVEFNYESWIPSCPLIHFDVKKIDMPEGRTLQFAGKPDEWFRMLDNMNRSTILFEGAVIKCIRDEMDTVFEGFTNHFGPVAALRVLKEELPSDVILTSDVGSHLHLIGQYWPVGSRSKLLMTNGWSSMGFGIPAALAAQLVSPGSTVACIIGDGGFLMMAGELLTARRYNLPMIVIVFSDGELNLIKVKQSWKDLSPYATLLYQGDLFGSDKFLGVKVFNADSTETMRTSINLALSLNEPVIINARIDPEDYKWLIVKR
ncbi:MAG TPA: thiamine pyrophosphate-binding protein [Bacteroidales bacterium]|nr:thiamine pyrophosphate-binding protein [Bacteroidales bacterium]